MEDEETVRKLAHRVLQLYGYRVLVASQGQTASQLCEAYQEPIHLLLTDVILPGGMSGAQLAAHLTALHPEMKVLYMSGYTDEAIVYHGVLDAGGAFLQKPFSPEVLVNKVRDVLDAKVGQIKA